MPIEFDPDKSSRNAADRGLPFSLVDGFDWDEAIVAQDLRKAYGEDRFIAVGPIGGLIHVVIYTLRGDNIRVISLRRANDREVARYDQARSVLD